jgi:AraC-like DNA-binding protein
MQIKYNKEKIEELLKDFAMLTRISVTFADSETNPIFSFQSSEDFCNAYQKIGTNKEYCHHSDQRLLERCRQSGNYVYHICHAGLYDAAMPIVKLGITVGYLMVGRIKTPIQRKDAQCTYEGALGVLYDQIPVFDSVQLSCLKNLLSNILFSNAIELENTSVAENIRGYIEENISNELTAAALCKRFFVSRNYLYKTFREHFGITPVEYITQCRLARAKTLLKETKEPVYWICDRVGIHNYTYFCNLFKKKTGFTPMEYRSNNR